MCAFRRSLFVCLALLFWIIQPVTAVRAQVAEPEVGEWERTLTTLEAQAKPALTIRGGLDVEVSGLNLLDRNYQLSPGFPEAGRVGLVQLRTGSEGDTRRAGFDAR